MLTTAEALTLAALADRPRYGYELVTQIRELSDGRVEIRPGNLYRVLDRLVEDGLVRETAAPASNDDDRRRYFALTTKGTREAAAELGMYAQILRKVPALREALSHG